MAPKNILFSIEPVELIELIRLAVKREIDFYNEVQKTGKSNSTKYYTRNEVAAILHVSVGTIDNYRQKGIINSKRFGSRILFSHDDVMQSAICLNDK